MLRKFSALFFATFGLRSVVRDRSSEIVYGTTLYVPTFTISGGFEDYTPGTALTGRTLSDAQSSLVLNQERGLAVEIDMFNEQVIRASISTEVLELMRREYMKEIETKVLAAHSGATPNTATTATKTADYDVKAGRQAVIGLFREMDRRTRSAYWPLEKRYAFIGAYTRERIQQYFLEDYPNAGTGVLFDQTFEDGTFGDKILGFRVYMTPNITDDLDTAADTGKVYFGIMGESVHFAQTLNAMLEKPIVKKAARSLEWYILYGLKVLDAKRIGVATMTQS